VRLFCDYMGYSLEYAAERAGPNDIISFASMLKNRGLASNSIRLYLSGLKNFTRYAIYHIIVRS
jgi:site-specific recombinase XerC